ncbi:hypothetical protein H1R20_g10386, partial [Candolleomyces eurysporus]
MDKEMKYTKNTSHTPHNEQHSYEDLTLSHTELASDVLHSTSKSPPPSTRSPTGAEYGNPNKHGRGAQIDAELAKEDQEELKKKKAKEQRNEEIKWKKD